MEGKPAEPHQPTSPKSDTALDVWVGLLADLIVAAVQREAQNAGNPEITQR
jgi:hypothetical protein